jgi:predicted deacylase
MTINAAAVDAVLIDRALAEDVGSGDVTVEATVPETAQAVATITQKAPGVISGSPSRRRSSGGSTPMRSSSGSARKRSGASRRPRCCASPDRRARC